MAKQSSFSHSGNPNVLTPLEEIKLLDKQFPIPRLSVAAYKNPEMMQQHERSVQKFQELIGRLAESFVVLMQDPDDGIKMDLLDFSPASLNHIDANLYRIDYPNAYTKDFLEQHYIPSLAGYLIKTIFRHVNAQPVFRDVMPIQWKYSSATMKHRIQPHAGGRTFNPFDFAYGAVFSGYRTVDFYTVIYNYGYLSEILSGKMKPFEMT